MSLARSAARRASGNSILNSRRRVDFGTTTSRYARRNRSTVNLLGGRSRLNLFNDSLIKASLSRKGTNVGNIAICCKFESLEGSPILDSEIRMYVVAR